MLEANIEVNENLVIKNNFSLEDAYKAGEKIVQMIEDECSIFCATDQLAIGVMRALHDAGVSIPKQAAIIGVDDIDASAYLTPSLSTIAIPKEEIGSKSAEMLIKLIEGKKVDNRQVLLEPELIIRETT